MEIRLLGSTGLTVPVIGLGTWRTFDVRGAQDEGNARLVVERALAKGAALFDSSPMYGESERVLAQALGSHRADALVATKVWASSGAEGKRQIERSMRLFGRLVDIYQVHNLAGWREQLPLLESERAVEQVVLPLAADLGLGVIVMRPFGEGSLLRRQRSDAELKPLVPFGVTTWAQALLKWILSDPRFHTTIPATSKSPRVDENAAAGNAPWFGSDEREYVAKRFA
jgi:aryl-alcohol dehydrogenase-like predicted oxidoreductase